MPHVVDGSSVSSANLASVGVAVNVLLWHCVISIFLNICLHSSLQAFVYDSYTATLAALCRCYGTPV